MIPAAIKVTVYFVGLIHFYHIDNATERKVFLLATKDGVIHEGVSLAPHHPHVEIDGLMGGKDACEARGASWNGAACIVKNLPAKSAITLPTSTTGFQIMDNFNRVPTLSGQCPGATVKPAALTDYAAVVTPTSGKLDACSFNKGLVTYLGLDNASGDLVINGRAFPLTEGARVYVSDSPLTPHSAASHTGEHFFWYYTILVPPSGGRCNHVPTVGFSIGEGCKRFAPTHTDSFPALSGAEFCGPVR